MKKIVALLVLLTLVLSLPVMASDFTSGTIQVDGIISAGEWDAAAWVELPCPQENVSLTGRIKMMNDKDYIYLLAESVDDKVCDTATRNWNGDLSIDCLELWLTVDVEGAKSAASYDTANAVYFCLDHMGNYSWNGGDSRAKDGIQYDFSFDGNKTTVYEVAIPMMDCADGGTIAMQVSFNDTDDENGSRCGYLVLNDAISNWWDSPKNLSTYTLAEYAEPVIEVVETETVTTAPQTFDAGIVAAACAIVSVAGYALSKKR